MLLPLIVVALSTLVAAQNTTFDPNSVDPTTKNQWCESELGNCLLLCGGDGTIANNLCESETLQYDCTCSNNSAPANIAQYEGTIPNLICQREYTQCITGAGSFSAVEGCGTCGTLQASDVPKTASPSATASLSLTTTSSAQNAPTSALTSQNTTASSTAPSADAKSSPPTASFSNTAKIGVGVGVSLGVIAFVAIIAGLILLLLRRKRHSGLQNASNGGDGAENSGPANEPMMQELDGDGDGSKTEAGARELDATELPPYSRELAGDSSPQRFELE